MRNKNKDNSSIQQTHIKQFIAYPALNTNKQANGKQLASNWQATGKQLVLTIVISTQLLKIDANKIKVDTEGGKAGTK